MIHLTKKDFRIDWYSGSGAGGQHRNKHQNCCRITHIDTGMVERGTNSRSRVENQRVAFKALAKRVVKYLMSQMSENKVVVTEVIRNYNSPRNEVHDKVSGLKLPYTEVVISGNIGEMIDARRLSMDISRR